MFRRSITAVSVAALMLLATGPASAAKPEPSWEFVEIATLAQALGVNGRNQVVGFTGSYYSGHAFVWDARAGLVDLHTEAGLPDDTYSVAHDINNRGTVVGWRLGDLGADYDTLVWGGRSGLLDISPGQSTLAASAVSSSGQVVGSWNQSRGFSWDSRTGYRDLEPLPGQSSAEGDDVNERGQIAGRSGTHAALWQPDGSVVDLGTFGGDWVLVTGINNRGQVVGSWFGFQLYNRGFLWDPHRGGVDLGESFMPQAINDSGQIVGRQGGPALMEADGTVHLLPIPEGYEQGGMAVDINNRGVIVGSLVKTGVGTSAVMWTPAS